jgi:hypothetical protein
MERVRGGMQSREKKTPTSDADVFKYLSWQEALEAL